jgi:cyanophycin synthetase
LNAVELRTLDGPNLYMLRPAIKLEIEAGPDERACLAETVAIERSGTSSGEGGPVAIATLAADVVRWIGHEVGVDIAEIVVRKLEEPGHAAMAYAWERRDASRAIGHLAWRLVSGQAVDLEQELGEIRTMLEVPVDPDDLPEMITEVDRHIPTIGITGTNGKTTTTRLIASIIRGGGSSVGWTSSAGVVINGEMVLPGDYTGPSGAARVFEEPGIEYAVLETARGGILLRGLGYEHNDVSVMTNISADHMGLHGVYSLDVLTDVKAVVARVTRPDGYAVLNADDPRLLALRDAVVARPFLFSRHPDKPEVCDHIAAGGWALVVRDNEIVWRHDGAEETIAALDDVPITFGGRAQHMVENALAATAACLAIGIPVEQVRSGLAAFRNRADQNRGRLNVYELDGATVVIDFAHNEAGIDHLLRFAKSFRGDRSKLLAVIGTAGDRDDAAITGIARIAAEHSDGVIVKDSRKYLRGREAGEMPALMRPVVGEALLGDAPSEMDGFNDGLQHLRAGDVLAVMCIEDSDEILAWLDAHGRPLS